MGATEKDILITFYPEDRPPQQEKPVFLTRSNQDIFIMYLRPDAEPYYYDKNGKNQRLFRTRFFSPPNPDTRYIQPKGSKTVPFFPPAIIRKFRIREKIDTLFITEGEFKAFAGTLLGLDFIGIPGIHNAREKNTGQLHSDILKVIEQCEVKNIILLLDADCLKVEYEPEKDLHKRPYSFYTAVNNFKEACKTLSIDAYFAHIHESFEETAKGLDDLISLKEVNKDSVVKELTLFTARPDHRKYIKCQLLRDTFTIKKYFCIDSVIAFYEAYQAKIIDKEFIYKTDKYFIHDGKPRISYYGQAKSFMRVGCDWYKIIYEFNIHGKIEERLKKYSIGEINRDFNQNREFIKQIPKYDAFTNEPDNMNTYKREIKVECRGVISKLYNLYHPINHLPQPGEWPTINRLLNHTGKTENLQGEPMYEFLLDYLQILYLNPKQRLPVLCLVSKERNTGKTTFLEFLRLIFGDNTTILDNERFSQSKFTSHYAGKLVICIDETFIDLEKKEIKERLKMLATGKNIWSEAKGTEAEELPNFSHLVLTSNEESNFMPIDKEENRYCVLKLDSLKNTDTEGKTINEDIPDMLKRMQSEVPAFLHFLQNRQLHYEPNKSRLSFVPEIYFTEVLHKVMDRTRPPLQKAIEEFITGAFFDFGYDVLYYTEKDIMDVLKEDGFKYHKNQISDYLKHEKGMEKEHRRYKVFKKEIRADGNTSISYDNKGDARVFTFKMADWLSKEDILKAREINRDLPPNF